MTDSRTANVIVTSETPLQFSQYERDADICIYSEKEESFPLEDVRSASRTIEVLSNSFYKSLWPGILENNVFTNNNVPAPRNNVCQYRERAWNEKAFAKDLYTKILKYLRVRIKLFHLYDLH